MPQDLYAIRREATELNALLKGAKVNKITEPSPEEIVMTVYNKTVYNVIFCAGARFPRVSLTNARKENPQNAPNFFECKQCPQYQVSCHPEVMKLTLSGAESAK